MSDLSLNLLGGIYHHTSYDAIVKGSTSSHSCDCSPRLLFLSRQCSSPDGSFRENTATRCKAEPTFQFRLFTMARIPEGVKACEQRPSLQGSFATFLLPGGG